MEGMKIVVTEIPDTPMDCLFSIRNCEYGMICQLRETVCKDTALCPCLTILK